MHIGFQACGVLGKFHRIGCRLVPVLLAVLGLALQPCAASTLLHVGCDDAAAMHYSDMLDSQPGDGCANADAGDLMVTEAANPLGKDARAGLLALIAAGHFEPATVAVLNARSARLAGTLRLPAPLHAASRRLLL